MDLAVFAAAALLFLLTRASGPYPGEPAAWTAAVSGLSPFPPLTRPLYAGLARLLAHVPIGAMSARLAVFSAFCAAAAVALMGRIVRAFPPMEPAREDDRVARWVSGLAASFALAFAFPFWFSATRASPEPLALALLLAAIERLIRYEQRGRLADLCFFAALYGTAMIEHPAALFFFPVVGVAAIVIILRRSAQRPTGLLPDRFSVPTAARRFAVAALCGGAGLIPIGLYAGWYSRQPAAQWRDLSGVGAVLRDLARAYYHATREVLPPIGWLLIVAFAAAPCVWLAFAPLFVRRKADVRPGHIFLSAALAGLSLWVLLLDALAPAAAAGLLTARAMPSAATAFALGRLSAWARPAPRARRRLAHRGLFAFRRVFSVGLLSLFALGLVAAPLLNGRLMRSAARQRYTDYARDVVRFLGGRAWLLLESGDDDLIAAALAEAGSSARVIRPALGNSLAYRRHLAAGFNDARLRDVSALGISPLLTEWLGRGMESGLELAALGSLTPWQAVGRRAFPWGPLTCPATAQTGDDHDGIARKNLDFANRYAGLFDAAKREPWPWTKHWNALVAVRASRAANNTGVWLEEEGRPDLAAEAYAIALRVHPDNLSALMNAALLEAAEGREPSEERIAKLRATADRLRGSGEPLNALSLIGLFGEIRRPDIYARRGLLWALAGRQAAAEAEWKRLGADAEPLRRAASEYFAIQSGGPESEAALRAIAERDNAPTAWIGVFRRALSRSDFAAAEEALERAAAAGAEAARLTRERALLDWTAGRREEARRALRRQDRDPEALALLAAMAAEAGHAEDLDRHLERLKEWRAALPPGIWLTIARIEMGRGAYDAARRALEAAWRARPENRETLELLLRLDVLQARLADARARVAELLAADPRHAFANRVLGSIQLHEGDWLGAETALRRSLAAARDPGALNDLAYALLRRQRLEEAVELAREATRLAPEMSSAWDTLGEALRESGKAEEAVEAARRAVELEPENATFLWNLAQVYEALKRTREAAEILAALSQRQDELPPQIRRQLRERRGAKSDP